MCQSALHLPTFSCTPVQACSCPFSQIPGLPTISLCREEQGRWQNPKLLRWCRHKIHCAWTVRHRDIFLCLKGQHIDFYSACADERHWGETAACFWAWGSKEQGHSGALSALQGRKALMELRMTDREQSRGSETTRGWAAVQWDDFSTYSHDAQAATVQQPAPPNSCSHFVLPPISSLRKVLIRKMMNMIYTCWLFQMLRCSRKRYTQGFFSFSLFSFLLLFFCF